MCAGLWLTDHIECAFCGTVAVVFATLNVSIAATGTGFLSFPFAFQQAGYVLGTAMCVGTSVLCAYSLTIIASCARQHNASSYQGLVKAMFGEWARQCVQWLVIVFNYTGNIASLQVISSQAAPLLAIWFPSQLAGSSPRCVKKRDSGAFCLCVLGIEPLRPLRPSDPPPPPPGLFYLVTV